MTVRCLGARWHSIRTWWRACTGTRAAHHRCTRATSSSGRAIGSPAICRLGCDVQGVECGVESPLAAPVGLMVGFGGHEPDQLVMVLVGDSEDGAVGVGADSEYQSLAPRSG